MIKASKLSSQVHKHLLAEILEGRLPSGTPLRETELATQLGVSRTPIREALKQLAAEGFVEVYPNRSGIVRRFTAEQLRQIYQVREALEGMAAELAAGHLTPADFAQLEKMAAPMSDEGHPDYRATAHRLDAHIHRLIAARSGNPILAREIERLHDLVQLMRERVGTQMGALPLAHQQHMEIIAALRAGDAVRSREAMVQHIRSSCELAVRCVLEEQVQAS